MQHLPLSGYYTTPPSPHQAGTPHKTSMLASYNTYNLLSPTSRVERIPHTPLLTNAMNKRTTTTSPFPFQLKT